MARKTHTLHVPVKAEKTPRWTPLTEDEAVEALRVARPAVATCLCGCGLETKSRFAPGHDATHKERLKATAAAGGPAGIAAAAALERFGW